MQVIPYKLSVKPDGQRSITKTVYATSLEAAKTMLSIMECCPVSSIKTL